MIRTVMLIVRVYLGLAFRVSCHFIPMLLSFVVNLLSYVFTLLF